PPPAPARIGRDACRQTPASTRRSTAGQAETGCGNGASRHSRAWLVSASATTVPKRSMHFDDMIFATILGREDHTGGLPWPHYPGFIAIVPDREDHTGGHPWPHSSIVPLAVR